MVYESVKSRRPGLDLSDKMWSSPLKGFPMRCLLAALALPLLATALPAAEPTAAERGYKALTQTAFIPASWRPKAYENAWKRWAGVTEKPADYHAAFRDYYGLHPAPRSEEHTSELQS